MYCVWNFEFTYCWCQRPQSCEPGPGPWWRLTGNGPQLCKIQGHRTVCFRIVLTVMFWSSYLGHAVAVWSKMNWLMWKRDVVIKVYVKSIPEIWFPKQLNEKLIQWAYRVVPYFLIREGGFLLASHFNHSFILSVSSLIPYLCIAFFSNSLHTTRVMVTSPNLQFYLFLWALKIWAKFFKQIRKS